jgi:glycosyltransferase involved in cell wall biosynthesis
MNVLMAHNHYLIRGGEDESFRAEAWMLRDAGHHVTEYTDHNDRIESMRSVRKAVNTLWSTETYGNIRRLLRQHQIDVLHVQNFFPLISPSIYYAARAERVPVVQSLRNYRLLCSNSFFFRDGKPCESCLGTTLQLPALKHACYRDDRAATATVVAMSTGHRLLGTWSREVGVYIALTEFARQKYIEGGWDGDKIVVKPNFVTPDPGPGEACRRGFVFVGRLSPEKGIRTLLSAWESLGPKGKQLLVIGDGPLRAEVESVAAQNPAVTYLGRQSQETMLEVMGKAEAVIVPSEWYETFGRVVIEAYSKATPVIASKIGALEEIVGGTGAGILFTPGDVPSLTQAVLQMSTDGESCVHMGRIARDRFESEFTSTKNLSQLVGAYDLARDRMQRESRSRNP